MKNLVTIIGFLIGFVELIKQVNCERKLVFAQVIFRHGARAPSANFSNETLAQFFPRGLGEMTDRGFENSHFVGRFLANRYVSSGFLDKILKPKEMLFRSVNLNRCLSTAATVGAAMFEDYGKQLHLNVAVTTKIDKDSENLLNYNMMKCSREHELIREKCPTYSGPAQFKSWPEYESFIADCLNYSHPVFEKYSFRNLEAHLNEYKNGIELPKDIAENLQEIMKIYTKVTHFIIGIGVHHNPRMMRIKFGNFVDKLLNNLENAWREYYEPHRSQRKFVAYSTQDWILMGVLEAFGVLNETIGYLGLAEYNSMIIMELYDNNDAPEVEFLFKKEEKTVANHPLINVSQFVRNCKTNKNYCELKNFLNCCSKYRNINHKSACGWRSNNQILIESSNSSSKLENLKRRVKRFSGPE